MSHTPGPWAVREPCPIERAEDLAEGIPPNEQELTEVYSEDDGDQVCYVMNTTVCEAANARLIAAAPDLLAACKALAHDIRAMQFTDGEYRLSLDSARSILALLDREISKAEGRE